MLLRTTTNGTRTIAPRRAGFVIVAVLMVVSVLSLAAYQYGEVMSREARAAERIRKAGEAKAFAQSGIHYATAVLADPNVLAGTLAGNPYDNSSTFRDVIVKDGVVQGRFSLMSFDASNAQSGGAGTRFGVTDESGKLNINALFALDSSGKVLHDALMKLPDMTDEIAWSVVDWVDPDEEPNAGGAESQYYSALSPPYQCKNAPLDSVEELLLVQGVTPQLLFGNDRNRNGTLDEGEDDGFGGLNLGWSAYLTVYSRERNVDIDGNPRINLNGDDLNQLKTDLTAAIDEETAYLIIAFRLFGSGSGMGMNAAQTGTIAQLKTVVDTSLRSNATAKQRISSVFALVNARIQIQIPATMPGRQPQTVTVSSPLASDVSLQQRVLPTLLDKTTTQQGTDLPPRVNVNTAPREVLLCLPGIGEPEADAILAVRPSYVDGSGTDTNYDTISWLLTDGTLPLTALQTLERYITARTQVYRVQAIGYFDGAGPIARVEAVIDVNQGKPRIAYYRDLTDLGRGLDPRSIGK